jgi:four helix bundle protein
MDAFEKLEVWKRSSRQCVDLYRALSECREFGLKDQISRSALSVPSNIAEGYERDSTAEYVRFLRIAKGSCGELRTQLYIAKAVGALGQPVADEFIQEASELSRMIHGLITKLRAETEGV